MVGENARVETLTNRLARLEVAKRSTTNSTWIGKFANALNGIAVGAHGQISFLVHGAAMAGVSIAAAWFGVSILEWCVLLLCIGLVVTAEYLNTSVEYLARAVTDEQNELVGAALDIASGAVLIASAIALLIGALILTPHLWSAWTG
jgi:diacylglycerol kinase